MWSPANDRWNALVKEASFACPTDTWATSCIACTNVNCWVGMKDGIPVGVTSVTIAISTAADAYPATLRSVDKCAAKSLDPKQPPSVAELVPETCTE